LSDEVTKNGNFIGQTGVNMFVNNGLLKTMLYWKKFIPRWKISARH